MSTFSFALQFIRSYRVRLTLISTFLVNSSLLFMVVVGLIDSCDFYFIIQRYRASVGKSKIDNFVNFVRPTSEETKKK